MHPVCAAGEANEIAVTDHATREDEALAAFQAGEKRNAQNIWATLADEGDVSAAWTLGYLHYTGEISDNGLPDYEKAAGFFSQAAAAGHCLACNALGKLLYFGAGIKEDKSAARRWLALAGEQGDDDAATSLGYLYEKGEGGEENFDVAFDWYSRSAEYGNAEGQYRLALAYLAGRGIPHNGVIGLFWLIKSAEQGHPSAREKRDELLPYIDNDIARRVFELTLERSSALH